VTEDLEHMNEKWNGAWLTKQVAAVEMIAAEEYVYIGPQGQVLDKADILEIIRSPSYQLARGSWTEVSYSRFGTDFALVLDRFRGEGESRGQTFKEDHRHTTVWVRQHGRWQVRLEHCSAITTG
jgi:ketosteroid isomerase-like protein